MRTFPHSGSCLASERILRAEISLIQRTSSSLLSDRMPYSDRNKENQEARRAIRTGTQL